MASGDKHEKPCPNCGHCPTCGRSNTPNYYWPWTYPWKPYPYPYGTGYPVTVWNGTTSLPSAQFSNSN